MNIVAIPLLRKLALVVVFTITSIVIFIPMNYLLITGMLIYLWVIPLIDVPVITFQIIAIMFAIIFSIGFSWIITEILNQKSLTFPTATPSVGGHMLRLGLFSIAILDGALYFWNIIGMLSALLLIWFGKSRAWKALGSIAWIWTLLIQIYVFLLFGV